MLQTHADCRRKADKYRKLAKGERNYSRMYFQWSDWDRAIAHEVQAEHYEELFRSYERKGRQRCSV